MGTAFALARKALYRTTLAWGAPSTLLVARGYSGEAEALQQNVETAAFASVTLCTFLGRSGSQIAELIM